MEVQIQPWQGPLPRALNFSPLRVYHGYRVDDAGGLPYNRAQYGLRPVRIFGISGRFRGRSGGVGLLATGC